MVLRRAALRLRRVRLLLAVAICAHTAVAQTAGKAPVAGTPWIGVAVDSLPELTVQAVEIGSPAALAGIQRGDRLVRVNGVPATYSLLASAMKAARVGDELTLTLRRGTSLLDKRVVAERRDAARDSATHLTPGAVAATTASYLMSACKAVDSAQNASTARSQPRPRGSTQTVAMRRWCVPDDEQSIVRTGDPHYRLALDVSGVYLLPLNESLAAYFDAPVSGLLVVDVRPASPAAKAGFLPGDVISRVGDKTPTGVLELRRALIDNAVMGCDVLRRGKRIQLVLRRDVP